MTQQAFLLSLLLLLIFAVHALGESPPSPSSNSLHLNRSAKATFYLADVQCRALGAGRLVAALARASLASSVSAPPTGSNSSR
jgi:hypothetical protein